MQLPDRIYIIGGSWSWKSTLAQRISRIKHIPHFALDDILWYKKYKEKLPVEQRTYKLHHTILQKYDTWVIEWFAVGWADRCYQEADLVIIFDVSRRVIAWRIIKRYILWILHWDFTKNFFEMIVLLRWAITYQNHKSIYSLRRHIDDCEKYKCNYVVIRDAKEILG
jgi:adenylate kinase family enzyme